MKPPKNNRGAKGFVCVNKYKSIWSLGLTPDVELIRTSVFVDEQGFAAVGVVFDELESSSLNIVLYENDVPIGTGRLVQENSTDFRIGRVAILSSRRKSGDGARLMSLMEEKAISLGARKILLSAQSHTLGFYKKCGYSIVSDEYVIHGCPHVDMEKDVG